MSNTQFAFIAKNRIPDVARWQASIDALGFDMKLDPDLQAHVDSGFLPCTLNGQVGMGFEIYYADTAEEAQEQEELLDLADGRDGLILMCWGGSMKDLACVLIASAALAADCDAVVSYEGEAASSLEDLRAMLPDVLEDAAKER